MLHPEIMRALMADRSDRTARLAASHLPAQSIPYSKRPARPRKRFHLWTKSPRPALEARGAASVRPEVG
jgi:hypothetical protein